MPRFHLPRPGLIALAPIQPRAFRQIHRTVRYHLESEPADSHQAVDQVRHTGPEESS